MALDAKNVYPDMERNFTEVDTGCTIIPQFSNVSVFVPELPGYGISTLAQEPLTKRTMGHSILGALVSVFSLDIRKKTPLVIIGHDRGARITHRLTVDYSHPGPSTSRFLTAFNLLGSALLDILPTTVQWINAAKRPGIAAAYFHWSLLARPDMAIPMLAAYGGDKFSHDLLAKGTGHNERGSDSFFAQGSVAIYTANFKSEDAIRGVCEDYTDGATTEVALQVEDQEQRRKIETPLMVIWSDDYLGRGGNVGDVWEKDWVGKGCRIQKVAVGEGFGHFLPEEAPDAVGASLRDWVASLGVNP